MDKRKRPMRDVAPGTKPRVVKLEAKPRRFEIGNVPMADVVAAVPAMSPRPFRAFGLFAPRLLALLLVALMIATPVSPLFAAEENGEVNNEERITNNGEESETNDQESGEEAEEGEESGIKNPDSAEGPTGEQESGEDTSDQESVTSDQESGEEAEETGDDDKDESEGDDGFNPDSLPSADNPAPEDWYEGQGVGEEIGETGNLKPETGDETEEETEETGTSSEADELKEQLRAEIYDEVLADLEEQISAFEEEKEKLEEGCLHYEDGSFFCLDPEREGGPTAPQGGGTGTVYAQKDQAEGDGEIFFLPEGGESAIPLTDDIYDDQFPAIDPTGRSFVWQSFRNDRWQIIYRDGATGVTEQLTTSTSNNMHPAVAGDIVVWQGWPASAEATAGKPGNWEVFMAQRQAPSADSGQTGGWSVSQITDNDQHDMFPKVAGGFITWQSNDGENWHVYAYEIATGETRQLSTGSGKHQNPRVALIWETEEDDGSRRILGLDLATGEVEPVGSRPATPDPADLPQPPLAEEDATVPTEKPETEDEPLSDDTTGNGDGDGNPPTDDGDGDADLPADDEDVETNGGDSL